MKTDSQTELELKGLRATTLTYDEYEQGYERSDPKTGITKSTTIPQPPQNLRLTAQNGFIQLRWDDQDNLSAPHKFEVQRSRDGNNYTSFDLVRQTSTTDKPGFSKDANGNPIETNWWYRVRIKVTTTNRSSGWCVAQKITIKPVNRLDINSDLAEMLENGAEVAGKLLQLAKSKGVELTEAYSNWGNLSNGYAIVDEGGIGETTKSLSYIFKNFIIADLILGSLIKASHIEAGTITATEIAANTITAVEIASKTITANEIQTDVLNALIANIKQSVLIGSTSGFTGFKGTGTEENPDTGDRRMYLDEDEVVLERFDGAAWQPVIRVGGTSDHIAFYDSSGNLASEFTYDEANRWTEHNGDLNISGGLSAGEGMMVVQGPQGVEGPEGPQGPQGDPGTTVPDISGLTELTDPVATSDYLIVYDASSGSHKKISTQNAAKAAWPVGTPFFQLPGVQDPSALNLPGVWEDVSDQWPGHFLRIDGGDAPVFEWNGTVSTSTTTQVTFTADHGLSVGSRIIASNGEQREVSVVNSTTQVTVSTAFSNAPTGTMRFVQGDAIRNITGHYSADRLGRDVGTYWTGGALYHYGNHNGYCAGSGGSNPSVDFGFDAGRVVPTALENRPVNDAMRVWQRTA